MSACADYQRHEAIWCYHFQKFMRWRTADGCCGVDCRECWSRRIALDWGDIEKEEPVSSEGIALRVTDRSMADVIGCVLLSRERFLAVEKERASIATEEELKKWPVVDKETP